jgi:hypothetical protein
MQCKKLEQSQKRLSAIEKTASAYFSFGSTLKTDNCDKKESNHTRRCSVDASSLSGTLLRVISDDDELSTGTFLKKLQTWSRLSKLG